VNSRLLLVVAGSAAVAAACDGAVRALTATPPTLTLFAGVVLVLIAMRRGPSRAMAVAVLAGSIVGLWLPLAARSAPRDVGVYVPRGHIAADLFEALDRLDADPSAFDGRAIAISGTWTPATPSAAATVSRRVMSCCAADAVDVGFDVAPRADPRIRPGTWVRVSGPVHVRLRAGDLRYEIEGATVTAAPR
jgi:uncharacterized protein DUF1980